MPITFFLIKTNPDPKKIKDSKVERKMKRKGKKEEKKEGGKVGRRRQMGRERTLYKSRRKFSIFFITSDWGRPF